MPSKTSRSILANGIHRDRVICACMQITAGDIEMYFYDGVRTIQELEQITNLGHMCRNCIKDAADLLQQIADTARKH